MFNHYNLEAFTYHILLELCVIYDTMDIINIFYIHCIIYMLYVWYMYIHIIFKCDSHINNICRKHIGLGP